jgi:hypothetical protein
VFLGISTICNEQKYCGKFKGRTRKWIDCKKNSHILKVVVLWCLTSFSGEINNINSLMLDLNEIYESILTSFSDEINNINSLMPNYFHL